MLTYFFIGAAIGALTGVPIGPVNVAVIDSAYRYNMVRALAVGLGGALADGLYAFLGILGVGPLLADNPSIPPILYGISGVVLIIYGAVTTRAQPIKAVSNVDVEKDPTSGHHALAGFAIGVALIIMNPAAIVTWVVIVGSFMVGVTQMEGLAAVFGITVGSFGWFTLVAYLADHGKKVLGDRAVWITRIVGMLLIGYGIFSLGRAAQYLFTEVW